MVDTKLVRHMTSEEYKESVVPLIVELKKILRKNFLKSENFSGLSYLTRDEFIELSIVKGRKSEHMMGDDCNREYATEIWGKFKMNETPIPPDLYNRYKELQFELSSVFESGERIIDLSKAHKDNKPEVRRCITDDIYLNEIKEGILDFETLVSVCESVGVRIPKRVYELKDIYEGSTYSRSEYVKSNNEFLKSIRISLEPFEETVKESKKRSIDFQLHAFSKSGIIDLFSYLISKGRVNDRVSSELSKFIKKGIISEGAEYKIEMDKLCNDYFESYILTFVSRLENKLNLVNSKWGIPKIEFKYTTLGSGDLETDFDLLYTNGKTISGDSKVILAGGGDIQVLHTRYLFNFRLDRKKINMEEIDTLS